MDKSFMHQSLQMLHCPQCGNLYASSDVGILQESENAILATITCAKCQHQSIVTLSLGGATTTAMSTDLRPSELSNIIDREPLNTDDLLDIHQYLKKTKGNFNADFKSASSKADISTTSKRKS